MWLKCSLPIFLLLLLSFFHIAGVYCIVAFNGYTQYTVWCIWLNVMVVRQMKSIITIAILFVAAIEFFYFFFGNDGDFLAIFLLFPPSDGHFPEFFF